MPSLSVAAASNASFSPSYIPVGVFIGGTSGVGEEMAKALARYTSGRAHIIIVGRNSTAAHTILKSLPKSTVEGDPEIRREFVYCEASLMRNIKATADALVERLPKINFLVITAGFGSLGGRNETEEGIDKQLALRYYSRWKFIYELMPLVRKARDAGEEATVASVLGAGADPLGAKRKVDLNDLALRNCWWTGFKVAMHSVIYNDYMMDEFARREPDIAFTHIAVGFAVSTPAMTSDHWLYTLFLPIIYILKLLIATTPPAAAEYMWYGLLNSDKGFCRRDRHGDDVGLRYYKGSEVVRKAIWDHSASETNHS